MTTWQKWKVGAVVGVGMLVLGSLLQAAGILLGALAEVVGQVSPDHAEAIAGAVGSALAVLLVPFLIFEVVRMGFPYLRDSLESRP